MQRTVSQGLLLALLAVVALNSMATSAMVGAPSKGDTGDLEVQRAANTAMTRLNANQELRHQYLGASVGEVQLVAIKGVEQQVVQGILYKLLLTVTDSNGHTFDMTAKIWSQPWKRNSNNPEEADQLTEAQRQDA